MRIAGKMRYLNGVEWGVFDRFIRDNDALIGAVRIRGEWNVVFILHGDGRIQYHSFRGPKH